MPQNPRPPERQAQLIRERLRRMAVPGGPLADAEVSVATITDAELVDTIDPEEPWPVNLKTIALDLVPDLNAGDVEVR